MYGSHMKSKAHCRACSTLLCALCGQKAPTGGEYLTEVWLFVSARALIKEDISWLKEHNKYKDQEGKRKKKLE